MQVIRKLNNNAVICKDSRGQEMIALGKGIGYGELPREISLSEIERSFYHMEAKDERIMQDLPAEVVIFSAKLLDIIANELPYQLSSNAVLLLADHLAFAIERNKRKIRLKMPISYDVKQMHPLEYTIGQHVLRRVQKEFQIEPPDEEIAAIAMNLINAKAVSDDLKEQMEIELYKDMLDKITEIVENVCHLIIDRDSFDYARFATHLHYLFQRVRSGRAIDTDNLKLYKLVKEEYPKVSECVDQISECLLNQWQVQLSEEEELYLILHVNRICVKEGL